MTSNPFKITSLLNAPLALEQCQTIYFAALQQAVLGQCTLAEIPESFTISVLTQQVHAYGWEAAMPNPALIAELFHQVTTHVYAAIELLYCDRLGRSIPTVYRIMTALAHIAGVPSLRYEVIWSICLFLTEKRQEATLVTRRCLATSWQVMILEPPLQIWHETQKPFSPYIICITDTVTGNIEAFRVTSSEKLAEVVWLAIYDAIVAHRRPSRMGACGLEWWLPIVLIAPATLLRELTPMTTILELAIEQIQCTPSALPIALQIDWTRALQGRLLSQAHFELLFDNYLFRCQSFGPRRRQVENNRAFAHLRGYTRDASTLFPALRTLLPSHSGRIDNGVVLHANFHYTHELLTLWPKYEVMLKRSQESVARCWIYLADEILCEAYAL